MRNKIVIVEPHAEDRQALEQILQGIVEEGGELFFSDQQEEAITIIKRESPQIVFLAAELYEKEKTLWSFAGVEILVTRRKNDAGEYPEDALVKPFRAHQVLERCRALLHHEPVLPIPPM